MAGTSELGELAFAIEKQVNDFTNSGNSEISFNATFTQPTVTSDNDDWHLQHLLMVEEADDKKLAFWRKLTDITFRSCTSKLVTEDDDRRESIHVHEGETRGLQFLTRFTLIQHKGTEGSKRLEISALDVEISEQVYAEVEPFLKTVVDSTSLHLFYQGFARYAVWWQQRATAFSHFVGKYPDVVSLPFDGEGITIRIRSPHGEGLVFDVYWIVGVSESGEATPSMHLITKVPEQLMRFDREGYLSRAPEMFQSLIRNLGIEEAIEVIVRLVTG